MPTLPEVLSGVLGVKEALTNGREFDAWERTFVIQQFCIDTGRAIGFQAGPNDPKVKAEIHKELQECEKLCKAMESKSHGQSDTPQSGAKKADKKPTVSPDDRTDIPQQTQSPQAPKPGDPVHPGSHRITRAEPPVAEETQPEESEKEAASPSKGGGGMVAILILQLIAKFLPMFK